MENVQRITNSSVFFDGVGKPTSKERFQETINEMNLNYEVEKRDIFDVNGRKIPAKIEVIRKDTGEHIAVTSNKFNPFQNERAFNLLESFPDSELVAVGGFPVGEQDHRTNEGFWGVLSTEPMKILNDDFQPYILFSNHHTGVGKPTISFVPNRIACENAIMHVQKQATNIISIEPKQSDIELIKIVPNIMIKSSNYLNFLRAESEVLAMTEFSREAYIQLAKNIIDWKEGMTDRQEEAKQQELDVLLAAYNKDDLQNFDNSAYRAIQAVADWETHNTPKRITTNEFIYFSRITAGMIKLNYAYKYIKKMTGYKVSVRGTI